MCVSESIQNLLVCFSTVACNTDTCMHVHIHTL